MASIRKRGSNSYLIVVSRGYDYEGNRLKSVQKTVKLPKEYTPKQAEKWVKEQAILFEREVQHTPEPVNHSITLAKYIEHWAADIGPKKLADSTFRRDEQDIRRILPTLGNYKLTDLRKEVIRDFYEQMRHSPRLDGRGNLSEKSVEGLHNTLCGILSAAVDEGYLIPQKYEMGKLMRAIQNEPILYRAYYTLAITTGLRRGELCALQWRDITGACELTVRRSRSCASGQIVESDTKSHRERIVTIPMGIWELLMALRQQQVLHSGVPDREQPIFTDPDGHVPHPDTFTRHLRKLYKKCGLSEDYHLHTLRHFYATYLLQEGTSKQVAASLLGHADTAFLERTYCHPQDVAKQQAAKLMQDLLNNQNPCYVAFMKNKNRKAKKAG